MQGLQTVRKIMDKTIVGFCVILFMLMTIVGTYQIVTRYFFNSPSTYSEEFITYSFTWLSILAASVVFGQRGHLCMAFVYNKFIGKTRVYADIFSEVLVILTAALLLIYGGLIMAQQNMTQLTASLGVPMGLMYAVLPIAGIIILVYGILNICDMIAKLKSPDVARYGIHSDDDE